MKLIIAQGNPGPDYTKSRHNIGFLALDHLRSALEVSDWQSKTKFKAEISELDYQGEKVILAKPTTFYNLTGQSARAIVDFYQIAPENILVIHDDLSLDFGKLRVRWGGADAGNKGIRSINQHFGQDFWRLKVGIDGKSHIINDEATFVLKPFSKNEQKALETTVLPAIKDIILDFLNNNIANHSQKTI